MGVYNRSMRKRDRFLRTLMASAVLLATLAASAYAAAPHAFLADGAQTALSFRLIQFVELRGDYQELSATLLEPPLQVQIVVHPSAASVQDQAGKSQGFRILQVLLDQFLPFELVPYGHTGVSVSGQIDEVVGAVDAIKIDRLRSTRGVTGESQPFPPHQRVDQAGFPYVTSPQKSDFRQPVGGEHLRLARAHYKFRMQRLSAPGSLPARAEQPRRRGRAAWEAPPTHAPTRSSALRPWTPRNSASWIV